MNRVAKWDGEVLAQ